MQTKEIHHPSGWYIELDRNRIIKDDPGADTPALVHSPCGKYTGTYWAALEMGEVDSRTLDDDIHQWIDASYDAVNEFLYPDDGEA